MIKLFGLKKCVSGWTYLPSLGLAVFLFPHDTDFDLMEKGRLIKIKEWVDKNDPGATIIPFSGAFENKWADMDDDEKKRFQEEVKATSKGRPESLTVLSERYITIRQQFAYLHCLPIASLGFYLTCFSVCESKCNINKMERNYLSVEDELHKTASAKILLQCAPAFERKESEKPFGIPEWVVSVKPEQMILRFWCSALDKIIVHGYKSLQLQYFFTSGPDEVKAWTIQSPSCIVSCVLIIHQEPQLYLQVCVDQSHLRDLILSDASHI
uniref:Uncharacterized protein n=1 Tax=Timema tahoe TaxID=61484 RepID=A0A7R9IH87_9NEOP|nr:unnamed protein product [Timema tahoe]